MYVYNVGYYYYYCISTESLFSDGAQGILQHQGYSITDFWQTVEFEDLLHLLVWGHWPSTLEKEAIKEALFKAV